MSDVDRLNKLLNELCTEAVKLDIGLHVLLAAVTSSYIVKLPIPPPEEVLEETVLLTFLANKSVPEQIAHLVNALIILSQDIGDDAFVSLILNMKENNGSSEIN